MGLDLFSDNTLLLFAGHTIIIRWFHVRKHSVGSFQLGAHMDDRGHVDKGLSNATTANGTTPLLPMREALAENALGQPTNRLR